MKKKSTFGWLVGLALTAAAVAAILLLIRKFLLPLLSDEIPENADPEEDIFDDAGAEDKEERFTVISSDHQPEEKRLTKIRRGYIPLKFHEKAEA